MENFYKKLFEDTMQELIEEKEKRKNERIEIIVKTVELQPLKNNSVYAVKFNYNIGLDEINSCINYLNQEGKKNQITFIPSCSQFQIDNF